MIRIIAGVYGHKENGVIMPKDSNSAPFSLDPGREAELVARGIAEYANVVIPDDDQDPGDDKEDGDDQKTGSSQQNDGDGQQDDGDQETGSGQQNDNDQEGDDSQGDDDGQQDDDQEGEDADKKQKPEYSEKMKLPELKEIAAAFGLDAQNMRTKAEVIKLLDDYFEDDGEQPPTFGALDPVE